MTREEKLAAIREWLLEYMPQVPADQRTMNFVKKSDRTKQLLKAIDKEKQRYNIAKELITRLRLKTSISEDLIIAAGNTILDMIEKELIKGYKVIIKNFGTFSLEMFEGNEYDVHIRFQSDAVWRKEYNAPLKTKDLGLFHKVKVFKKRKLRRLNTTLE